MSRTTRYLPVCTSPSQIGSRACTRSSIGTLPSSDAASRVTNDTRIGFQRRTSFAACSLRRSPSAGASHDDLTILLGLITASVFLLHNLYRPQSLVHPILLGRQSDVARVRTPGESAVHRNYTTGLMGRFTVRPAREVMTLLDFIKPVSDAPRSLWSTKISNAQLAERIKSLGTELSLAGLTRDSNVLLLMNDGIGERYQHYLPLSVRLLIVGDCWQNFSSPSSPSLRILSRL
ncbi:hypothetical protein EI94DRAFT_1640624 [Lactarius quietus]|nr:hypothetical protein EI94DRAFT_1640624 [Lactarius quietus]